MTPESEDIHNARCIPIDRVPLWDRGDVLWCSTAGPESESQRVWTQQFSKIRTMGMCAPFIKSWKSGLAAENGSPSWVDSCFHVQTGEIAVV